MVVLHGQNKQSLFGYIKMLYLDELLGMLLNGRNRAIIHFISYVEVIMCIGMNELVMVVQ